VSERLRCVLHVTVCLCMCVRACVRASVCASHVPACVTGPQCICALVLVAHLCYLNTCLHLGCCSCGVQCWVRGLCVDACVYVCACVCACMRRLRLQGRHLYFILVFDGFAPFEEDSKYSCTPIVLLCLNVPPQHRMSPGCYHVLCIVAGTRIPKQTVCIKHALDMAITELNTVLVEGVEVDGTTYYGRLLRGQADYKGWASITSDNMKQVSRACTNTCTHVCEFWVREFLRASKGCMYMCTQEHSIAMIVCSTQPSMTARAAGSPTPPSVTDTGRAASGRSYTGALHCKGATYSMNLFEPLVYAGKVAKYQRQQAKLKEKQRQSKRAKTGTSNAPKTRGKKEAAAHVSATPEPEQPLSGRPTRQAALAASATWRQ
jgi:hypothetical protein